MISKTWLVVIAVVLMAYFVVGGITSQTLIEESKETSGVTSEKTKILTASLIAESEDAKSVYYDKGSLASETKTEIKTFEGTNTVLVTTYYSNGTKATIITTKDKIDYIEIK